MSSSFIEQFVSSRQLPDSFRHAAARYFLPLAKGFHATRTKSKPLLVGINGAQGTGKSTLAGFLATACRAAYDWQVAVLSIDDFYLTRSERAALAKEVHPLFETRGVPGTHDVTLMSKTLAAISSLGSGDTLALPRFDKSQDDRAKQDQWPMISGPVELILLEGWCVGTQAQSIADLETPINELEQNHDPTARWRRYANEQLVTQYAPVFNTLDLLVFLQAPDFESIYKWRCQQERRLGQTCDSADAATMSDHEIGTFIQHFERLTYASLATMPAIADFVFRMDNEHHVSGFSARSMPGPGQ